jgi:hypothetical protein
VDLQPPEGSDGCVIFIESRKASPPAQSAIQEEVVPTKIADPSIVSPREQIGVVISDTKSPSSEIKKGKKKKGASSGLPSKKVQ